MKRWKKLLSFALALAMIAGVTANNLHYLKAEAADGRPDPTGIPGDANGDGRLSVSDLVRAVVELSDGSRLCSVDALFTNRTKVTSEDIIKVRERLLYKGTCSVTVNVTGVDSNPNVTVTRENDAQVVYQGAGSFSTVLPVGNYVVTAESDTAVAKAERFTLDGDNPAAVNVKTMAKVEPAIYKNQYDGDTAAFVFEPENGIYRGSHGWFNTGVLETPVDVNDVDEWVLEADVQILSDTAWPSVGLALYNGSDFAQNVKFEILRNTDDNCWWLRTRKNVDENQAIYYPNANSNSTEKWVAANQEILQGKVHLAVVHVNGEYMMLINGSYLCAITGDEAANLTNGWGSVRLGFYAEQEATIENWNYSTDVSKYARLESAHYTVDGGSWSADTVDFTYEENTGIYRGNWTYFNTGVLNIPGDVKSVKEWVLEADVEVISDERYPSVGFALYNGSDYGQNVKFEIVRATANLDDKDNHERLIRMNGVNYVRGDSENGAVHSDWVAVNQDTLKGKVHLAVVHFNGEYRMFINGIYLGAIAADLTNGWGSVRLGFYAEQEATIENWNYSTDVSKYARLESATYMDTWGNGKTEDFAYDQYKGIYKGLWSKNCTGLLEKPIDVKNANEWALEADVQIISDASWPAVGLSMYNGEDITQNVHFKIMYATLDNQPYEWWLNVKGANVTEQVHNLGSQWNITNQSPAEGKVRLALVHKDGKYGMCINDVYMCAITGEEAANLTKDWGSVRLGFYAEHEVTIENWNFSTDVSKYSFAD